MEISDKAYIAGFFDGEGSILIRNMQKNNKKYSVCYYPEVSVVNTHKPVIKYIQKMFGGRIGLHSKYEKRFGRKELYKLTFRKEELTKLLLNIKDYLRIKKENANIVLEFTQISKKLNRNYHGQIQRLTKTEIKKRKKLYHRYKQAQKIGRKSHKED